MKKLSALFLTVIILVLTLLPLNASAVVVSLEDGLSFNPGNTRWLDPEYNYAWLDQLFIRSDSTSITTVELTPVPDDYAYSHTYDDFVEECDRYIDLYNLNDKTIENVYSVLIEVIYYSVVSMDMTEDFDVMCDALMKNGIELPDEATTEDKMKIAIVYAAIEYDAIYIIYNKRPDLPAGITLDAALTAILGELTGVTVPSGVDTVAGLGVQAVKQYLGDYNHLPMSNNPSNEEIFYWLKVAVSSENGYSVPFDKFNKVTDDDKEYVDYTYFSSVLETGYDVKINPESLLYANTDEDPLAVHRLLLTTMLDEKGSAYSDTDATQNLFDLVCKEGYFPLENEFYSDVLRYNVEVAPSTEKMWFTPITLGDQLNGGDKSPISIYLQGNCVEPGSTTAATLDPSKKQETVHLEVVYSSAGRQESALYEFCVTKVDSLETTPVDPTDVIGQVQNAVGAIIPTDNDIASQAVDNIFNDIAEISTTDIAGFVSDVLSTYENEISSALNDDGKEEEQVFGYLEDLLDNVYETDADGNIITTKVYTVTTQQPETTTETIIQKVTQTVTENPEIIAAPSGLIALGGLLGFMMNKKHKDSLLFSDENGEE